MTQSIRFIGTMLCLVVSIYALIATAHAAPLDSLEGKWLGTEEYAPDKYAFGKTTFGLEFKRTPQGQWKVFMYQPVMHFYGLELPSGIKASGEIYTVDDLGATVSLVNGVLKGSVASGAITFVLRKTDNLPAEPQMPNIPTGPKPKWQAKLGSAIFATAAVRDSTAYVGTTGGVFNAIHLGTGSFVWTFSAGRPMYGEALATSDAIYFVCDNGFLFKLNRQNGKEVWRYDLGDAQVSRILPHQVVYDYDTKAPKPVLADSVVYVGSGDGSFHAVHSSSGKRLWRFEAKGKIRTDALVNGAQVIFGTLDNFLYALDCQSGKEIWKKDMKGAVNGAPALIDGKLIVGTRGAVLYALNPGTSDVLWRTPYWGSWVESTPVPYKGMMYIGSSDLRSVACYDPKDAHILWRTDVYGWAWHRPAVSEKFVYVGVGGTNPYMTRHHGSITALERTTGNIAWRIASSESGAYFESGFVAAPVLEGKMLIIGGLDGSVYGLEVE